jgi:rhodanese-related sulfurtransferase
MTRDELHAALGRVTVVDAQPPARYGERHLPGALNLVPEDADEDVEAALPDRAAAIVVYSTDAACRRALELAARLAALGYGDVRLYREGLEDWIGAGLELERPRGVTFELSDLARSPTAFLFEGFPRAGVDVSIFVTRTPPGRAAELHVHPYAEIFLLLAGRGRWTRGEETVELEPEGMLSSHPTHRTASATSPTCPCSSSPSTSAARCARHGWAKTRPRKREGPRPVSSSAGR